MFDKNLHVHGSHTTTYVDRNVTVHEHRAPTDESINLANEMRDKVEQNFIGSFPLENNLFNAMVYLSLEPINYDVWFLVRYKINHQTHEVKFSMPANVMTSTRFERDPIIANKIIREVSNDIAKMLHAFTVPGPMGCSPQLVMPAANEPYGSRPNNQQWAARDCFVFTDRINSDGSSANEQADIENKFEFIKMWTNGSGSASRRLVEKLKDLWWFNS